MTRTSNLRKLLIAIIICLFQINAFAQWKVQNSTVVNSLHGVHFIDDKIGYAVGQGGTMIKTSNGGQTWTTLTSVSNWGLFGVHYLDKDTGFIAGGFIGFAKSIEELHITNNGGASFSTVTGGSGAILQDIYFVDNKTGFAVGIYSDIFGTSDTNVIIKSVDNGTNWSLLNTGFMDPLYAIHFVDSDTGFVCGKNGAFARTTNGGASWTKIVTNTSNNLRDVYFINADTGIVVGDLGLVMTSSDGGKTFTKKILGTEHLYSVVMTSVKHAFTVGEKGVIFHSTNSGISWASMTSKTGANLYALTFGTPSKAWAVGDSGVVVALDSIFSMADVYEVPDEIGLYPNPAASFITLDLQVPSSSQIYLTIYNAAGIVVQKNSFGSVSSRLSIPVSDLYQGMYFLECKIDGIKHVRKFIIY